MNNMFLEGPIQTGKSTLIRKILAERFGPALDGVGGFTCQRITFPTRQGESAPAHSHVASVDSVSRFARRIGFRLMPAAAPIAAHTCVVASIDDLISSEGVFKVVGSEGCRIDMNVFETTGVQLMEDALSRAESETSEQSKVSIILLDEIGGHEMVCPEFRRVLYELLESDVPCVGVVKLEESARNMVSRMPASQAQAIIEHNRQLHKKITGADGSCGEILYFERGDVNVADRLEKFVCRFVR